MKHRETGAHAFALEPIHARIPLAWDDDHTDDDDELASPSSPLLCMSSAREIGRHEQESTVSAEQSDHLVEFVRRLVALLGSSEPEAVAGFTRLGS